MSRMRSAFVPLALLTGCSHFGQLASGPGFALDHGSPAWGASAAAEAVVGSTSPSEGFTGIGLGARATWTRANVDLAAVTGPHVGAPFGPAHVDGGLRLGTGLELQDSKLLAMGVLGASLTLGVPISDSGWHPHASLADAWGVPQAFADPMPVGGPDVAALARADAIRYRGEQARERVMVTVSLVGDVDVRFTREPLFVPSLLIGVAWLDQVRH